MHWGWARSETCETVDRLLSNAVKYSLQNTETLCLTRPRRELAISVWDQGGGYCSKEQVRIFERFYQVTSVSGEKPVGAGLGLAICKCIVEAH